MSGYQLTPQAIEDLFDIWCYIADDNPRAADAVEEAILNACAMIGHSPLAGRVRRDLTDQPVRFWL